MNEQQQQAAALVAAAVANELIENHAQSLNLNTLNQVVAAKLITTSANRLATNNAASPSPDLYKNKLINGGKPASNRASPLVTAPPVNGSPLASLYTNGNGLARKSIGLDQRPAAPYLNGYL